MALDAAQILRQTYAAGAERIDLSSLMQKAEIAPPQSGSIMGTAFVVEADPAAELMDSMEELSFQFEEKTAKKVADRKLGEMQGPRMELVKAVEKWLAMMPDMPGREFIASMARNLRGAAKSGGIWSAGDGTGGARVGAGAGAGRRRARARRAAWRAWAVARRKTHCAVAFS